jgi:hypothetical protein
MQAHQKQATVGEPWKIEFDIRISIASLQAASA